MDFETVLVLRDVVAVGTRSRYVVCWLRLAGEPIIARWASLDTKLGTGALHRPRLASLGLAAFVLLRRDVLDQPMRCPTIEIGLVELGELRRIELRAAFENAVTELEHVRVQSDATAHAVRRHRSSRGTQDCGLHYEATEWIRTPAFAATSFMSQTASISMRSDARSSMRNRLMRRPSELPG